MPTRLTTAAPLTTLLEQLLASHGASGPEDVALIRTAVRDLVPHPAGSDVLDGRDGLPATVVSGWIGWAKLFADGRRQIVSLYLPGDILSGPALAAPGMVHVALTEALTASAAPLAAALREGQPGHERLCCAWARTEEAAKARLLRQLVRLGRLSAYERTADLLLEVHERQRRAGGASGAKIQFPVTQEALADVLGLSIVHANRVLQQLRRERLVVNGPNRTLTLDLQGLAAVALVEA